MKAKSMAFGEGRRGSRFPRYVPVSEKKARGKSAAKKMKAKGAALEPVEIDGRTIAKTFWGKAWCDNLEAYSDYENRLPRGRTYARNGSIIDLRIEEGLIQALVAGSSVYKVEVRISTLDASQWKELVRINAGQIGSLIDLLQGKLSQVVMERVVHPKHGLFPNPSEITLHCSCPDWATMCKHVAAVMYGIGHRLDHQPELLFKLRKVDHLDLMASAGSVNLIGDFKGMSAFTDDEDLGELFGIDMDLGSLNAAQTLSAEEAGKAKKAAKPAKAKKAAKPVKLKKVTSPTRF